MGESKISFDFRVLQYSARNLLELRGANGRLQSRLHDLRCGKPQETSEAQSTIKS
jgi:hypothetical protein